MYYLNVQKCLFLLSKLNTIKSPLRQALALSFRTTKIKRKCVCEREGTHGRSVAASQFVAFPVTCIGKK